MSILPEGSTTLVVREVAVLIAPKAFNKLLDLPNEDPIEYNKMLCHSKVESREWATDVLGQEIEMNHFRKDLSFRVEEAEKNLDEEANDTKSVDEDLDDDTTYVALYLYRTIRASDIEEQTSEQLIQANSSSTETLVVSVPDFHPPQTVDADSSLIKEVHMKTESNT
ncbi:hypothetical protein RND71_001935 [Anisodus tanguticus]|uniref:Uncharacterized protein n=1 Tax=Anisodus tanguticus TaxID=243964 RepID=A0AAE1T271_9SOLA|nr:hypothetical protein RND71_001935 [Anisodus tanguticus]